MTTTTVDLPRPPRGESEMVEDVHTHAVTAVDAFLSGEHGFWMRAAMQRIRAITHTEA